MNFKVKTSTLKRLLTHVGIVISLFCLLSFVLFNAVLPFVANKGKVVLVPDLKGMTIDQAKQFVTDKNVTIEWFHILT
ncbi:hypothetical protein [Chryseosolibacter indicus]|uniref:PASTA domain-containing protein n=1 Tax=Chryseosolibacter indicus TaxID=2782351 RepID=A0ABS5VPG9_9BACT|nr:hypothetical protein [Chryseosolibacter indicus]MBT1701911.1 hypothetical protein [Chryseosolibacter indicus]